MFDVQNNIDNFPKLLEICVWSYVKINIVIEQMSVYNFSMVHGIGLHEVKFSLHVENVHWT